MSQQCNTGTGSCDCNYTWTKERKTEYFEQAIRKKKQPVLTANKRKILVQKLQSMTQDFMQERWDHRAQISP